MDREARRGPAARPPRAGRAPAAGGRRPRAGRPGRPARVHRAGAQGARRSEAYRRHDHRRAGRDGDRAVAPGRPRGPLRPRRSSRVPEQRHHERRPRPGGGGRIPRRRLPAPARLRWLAAPDDPGCLRAARRDRGLCGRRRPGHRHAGLRRRPARGRPLRAGRPGHRPGQHLRHGREARSPGRHRHRLGGRADRGHDPRRRDRGSRARGRRPHQPGRARRHRGRGARHRLPGPRAGRDGRARATGGGNEARRAHPRSPRWNAERDRPRRRPRGRAEGRRRLRGGAPRDPHPRRPRVGHPGPQRRGHLRGHVLAGVPRRLRRRLQPCPAHGRLGPALLGTVRAVLPARHPCHRLRRERTPRCCAARAGAVVRRGPARTRRRHPRAVPERWPCS